MTYAAQLIDAVKAACGHTSDGQLAEALGVARPNISMWRNSKGSPMPEERVMQLCEMAKIADPGPWLVGIHADSVRATSVRKALESVLDRARPVVATAGTLAVVLLAASTLSNVHARSDNAPEIKHFSVGMYIM